MMGSDRTRGVRRAWSWRCGGIARLAIAAVSAWGCSGSAAAAFAQPHASAPAADESATRAYLAGNGLLSRGMYELAAAEYRKFLAEHADHEKAPQARYGLGV